MLPGFLLMLGLSVLYVEAGFDERFDELFYGLKAAVGALVAMAIVRLGRAFIADLPLLVIALAAAVAALTGALGFVAILLLAGLANELYRGARVVARGTVTAVAIVPAALAVAAVAAAGAGDVFLEGLRAGLLTFGGAYTSIPFIQEAAVESHGWLSADEFVDGLAIGGVLPAPLIIFATFVGYLAAGLPGSLAMTVGIFLPAFVFPIFLHRPLVAVAEHPRARPFLLGVAAAVIGLIAAVTVDIVRAAVVDVPSAVLAVAAFAALFRWHARLTVLYVVLGCGVAGAAWQMLH
jgi:chromate transporter